jgi:hypothetical protein
MRFLRRQTDEIESMLRARRSEPRDELVDAIVNRVAADNQPSRRPLALGIAAAAVGIAMFGAFGGLSYASSATQSVADVISAGPSVKSPATSSAAKSPSVNQNSTPSTNQYGGSTTICHKLGNGGFNLIAPNNNALPAHKAHGDTLPGPGGTCPGPPIP